MTKRLRPRTSRAIMALETQIAELHWPVADRRERERTYNLMSKAQVRALAPNYPWNAHFDARGLGGAVMPSRSGRK